jgi:neutral ceramidase
MIKSIVPTLLVMLTCPFQLSPAAEQLKVGVASAVITPSVGFPMWGYAARKDLPSVGVLDQLKARALVLEVGDERLAIVSLDLGRAPTREHTAAIRERVRDAGITNVMLVASHTHHGPVLELDTWPDAKHPYTAQLDQQLIDVILAAAKNLTPAKWGVASRETQLNHNRQSKRPDAPVDRTLSILRFESLDGRPIAHAVNFAAHPTMTDGKDLRFSADYVGSFAALVEQETGVPCLFLQGAAGELSPQRPAGVRSPAEFGQALGKEVLDLAKTIHCDSSKKPMLKVAREEFTFKARLDVGNPIVKAALSNAFFPDLIAFYEREYRDGVRPQMTVAVLDDRLGLVGVSGEFFSSHAIGLRRRARMEHLLFCGYCNDYQQYFPTIEAASEGGYGTAAPIALAELGAGERVMDRALIRLYRLRGMLAE